MHDCIWFDKEISLKCTANTQGFEQLLTVAVWISSWNPCVIHTIPNNLGTFKCIKFCKASEILLGGAILHKWPQVILTQNIYTEISKFKMAQSPHKKGS